MKISVTAIDLVADAPAVDLVVALHVLQESGEWLDLGTMPTDEDGKVENMLSRFFRPKPSMYRLSFATSAYFGLRQMQFTVPVIPVLLQVDDIEQDFDVRVWVGSAEYRVSVETSPLARL